MEAAAGLPPKNDNLDAAADRVGEVGLTGLDLPRTARGLEPRTDRDRVPEAGPAAATTPNNATPSNNNDCPRRHHPPQR